MIVRVLILKHVDKKHILVQGGLPLKKMKVCLLYKLFSTPISLDQNRHSFLPQIWGLTPSPLCLYIFVF